MNSSDFGANAVMPFIGGRHASLIGSWEFIVKRGVTGFAQPLPLPHLGGCPGPRDHVLQQHPSYVAQLAYATGLRCGGGCASLRPQHHNVQTLVKQ